MFRSVRSQYFAAIAGSVIVAGLLRWFVLESFYVHEQSYEPHFFSGDYILAIQNRPWIQKIFDDYAPGEWIVVRKAPLRDQWALRRVIQKGDGEFFLALGEQGDRTTFLDRDVTNRVFLILFSWDTQNQKPRWERTLTRP